MEEYPKNERNKFLEYLEGNLDQEDAHAFEKEIFGNNEAHKRLDEYRTVLEGMEQAPTLMPNKNLTEQFFQTLQAEKEKQQPNTPVKKLRHLVQGNWWLQIAAAILLFSVGYLVDKQISVSDLRTQEMSALKEEIAHTKHMIMLSMLNQESASKRLQAVNYSYDIPNNAADQQLVEALVHAMNYDDNVNVRLAAAEAIYRFADQESIRMAMIQSLKKQEDPEMQLLLIDMLTSLKEQKALGVFETLAKKENLLQIVKSKANQGLEVLL